MPARCGIGKLGPADFGQHLLSDRDSTLAYPQLSKYDLDDRGRI